MLVLKRGQKLTVFVLRSCVLVIRGYF